MLLLLLQFARAAPPPPGVACPVAEDTVAAATQDAPLPLTWIRGFLRGDCANPEIGFVVSRLGRDTAALARFERLLRGQERDSLLEDPKVRVAMLDRIMWRPETDALTLLLDAAAHPPASFNEAMTASYRGNPFGAAMFGLARYVRDLREVQERIGQLERSDVPFVRLAAFRVLLHANDPWSRAELARFPVRDLGLWLRAMRDSVLARPPCAPGTYFGWTFGQQGMGILGCQPPPPADGWF